ncbi:MAG: transglycosylase SLT domain-containing protein [Brevinematales bacterium]|nr:transglycosylase SLT domain-containing protein [Brevinematales bacterium]
MKKLFFLVLLLWCGYIRGEDTPFDYYKNYSFRRVVSSLTNKKDLSAYENYIIATSFFKMKKYADALFYYSKVNFDSFSNNIFRDNFITFYTTSLNNFIEEDSASYSNYLYISNLVFFYTNNIYFDEVEKNYVNILWKTKDFDKLVNYNFMNTNLSFFKTFASLFITNSLFQTEEPNLEVEISKFSILLDYFDFLDRKIIDNLEQKYFENLISFLIKKEKFKELENILKEYYVRFGESDFYYRNYAFTQYRLGNKNEAIELLENYIKNGTRVSWQSFKTFLDLLLKEKLDEKAYSYLKKYKDFYGPSYYDYWIRVLKRTDRYLELYNWYLKLSQRVGILPEYEREVFRTLLRNNLSLAKKMASSLKGNNKFYYTYSLALINYQNKNYKSAYTNFLTIVIDYPFTYEWIVSLKYEKELRENNKKLFYEKIATKIGTLNGKKNFSKDDLLFYYAIDYYYPELKNKYKNLFNKLSIAIINFQNNFSNNIVRSEKIDNKFDKFIELEKNLPDYMCLERIKLLEKVFDKKYNLSLFYDNYDFFTNRGMEHYIVSYMNGFIINYLEKKDYFILLNKNDILKIFPTNHLEKIETYITDKDMALWAISFVREESHFRKEVVSWANAIGIAQIIPPTFEMIKKAMKLDINIYDFDDNLLAGIYHFKYLLNKYRGNIFYAVAAYNSGEGSVNKWKQKYNYIDELWAECVEYNETYYYIRKIIFSHFIYEYLVK